MPSVSADNQALTNAVARIHSGYRMFQTTLRGQVAVVLAGLADGTHNLVSMNRALDLVAEDYLNNVRMDVLEDLSDVSTSALKTSRAESDPDVALKALAVADALHRGFQSDIESSLSFAVSRDVKTAQEFLRQQIVAGRYNATTDQLAHDLTFQVTGKQTLATDDYVKRQVNWSYRQQYNTLVVHTLLAREVDEARVDGGSSDGSSFDLLKYDELQARLFHHNTKALLQPLDEGV